MISLRTGALAGAALAVSIVFAGPAAAHSGGLNAEGCHNNRKTGDYHCHRGGGDPPTRRAQGLAAAPGGRPFANCSEARAAGAAPVRRGDPGYAPRLDRDGDGVGCEN